MAAIDNLAGAVEKLTASVDRAVEKLGQPSGVPEADVQAAADAVAAQADRLDSATGSNS